MLLFRIFVLNQRKVNKITGRPVPTTLAEPLADGVETEGSEYKEVSTKYPGSRLEGF